jgi:hypothetical protein
MKRARISAAALLAVATAIYAAPPAARAQTAQEVVAAADKVRNPGEPFRLTDTLVEYRDGKPQNRLVLMVYSKLDPKTGQFRNLVRYLDPARDAGKMLLMSGSIMWFYDPASSASVRISPQQRLLGQASNGDVMTINLARDYTAKMLGEESIQDADRKDRACLHLDLTAATEDAVYARVEYWVEKGTNRPIKGKFYSDSGRLLKIIYYRKYEEQLGGTRPAEAIIIDQVDSSLVTKMTLSGFESVAIPESWFQREYLPHLKGS